MGPRADRAATAALRLRGSSVGRPLHSRVSGPADGTNSSRAADAGRHAPRGLHFAMELSTRHPVDPPPHVAGRGAADDRSDSRSQAAAEGHRTGDPAKGRRSSPLRRGDHQGRSRVSVATAREAYLRRRAVVDAARDPRVGPGLVDGAARPSWPGQARRSARGDTGPRISVPRPARGLGHGRDRASHRPRPPDGLRTPVPVGPARRRDVHVQARPHPGCRVRVASTRDAASLPPPDRASTDRPFPGAGRHPAGAPGAPLCRGGDSSRGRLAMGACRSARDRTVCLPGGAHRLYSRARATVHHAAVR